VINLSKKRSENENAELEKLKKEIIDLRRDAEKNYHRMFLKYWGIMVVIATIFPLIFGIIFGVLAQNGALALPALIDSSEIAEIAPVIFTATITVNGLIIGFSPLVSIFFTGQIREREEDLERDWKSEKKKLKGAKLKLNQIYNTLIFMLLHNVKSGVLKYTETYIAISIMTQVGLILGYILTAGNNLLPLGFSIDFFCLSVVIFGLLPLLGIAFYLPSLKFVRYLVVEKEILRIEPEA
jgi:hypothetical protein